MRFHFLRYLSLLLFLLATDASAQTAEKRVLFIVETSKETKSLAEAERRLVGALVETGLGGLLEANDSFGVWTFNETLHVGKFPMQRWTPDGRKLLVQRVHDFLKSQPHEKSPRIETVWRPLQTVIRNSPALMVVLVTSGKHAISGTPFDDEINSHLKSSYRDYQKKKTPAVVVLSATSGDILRYSVNPAIGDVRIPVLTMPINVAPVVIAQPAPTPKTDETPSKPKIAAPAPKADTDAAFVITKEGLKNVSRLEADRISADNLERNPAPVIEPLAQIPPVPEITGPMILKHEVEVITHTVANEPPSAKLDIAIPAPQKKSTKAEVLPQNAVPAPKPVTPQVPEPVQPTPAVANVEPKQITVPEVIEPIASEKPVTQVAIAKVVPVESVQKVETITPVTPDPTPVAQVPAEAPKTSAAAAEIVSTPPPVSIPMEAKQNTAETIKPQPMMAQASPPPARSLAFLMGAAALILVAIFLAFLVGRQTGKRPQQSLVSDWAERDRAKK